MIPSLPQPDSASRWDVQSTENHRPNPQRLAIPLYRALPNVRPHVRRPNPYRAQPARRRYQKLTHIGMTFKQAHGLTGSGEQIANAPAGFHESALDGTLRGGVNRLLIPAGGHIMPAQPRLLGSGTEVGRDDQRACGGVASESLLLLLTIHLGCYRALRLVRQFHQRWRHLCHSRRRR
jgi:hypothetical protein